jgi:hypothetical protein
VDEGLQRMNRFASGFRHALDLDSSDEEGD